MKAIWRESERERFVVGRALLRTILGRYVGIEPGKIRFSYDPHGKPSLEGSAAVRRIRFNMSHSNDFALCVVTTDWEIGVDIEHISSIPEAEQIAKRFFSNQEFAVVHSLTGTRKEEAFFQIWTRKEAYLKARGEGLFHFAAGVEDPVYSNLPPGSSNITGSTGQTDCWSVAQLSNCLGYVAAVAMQGPIRRLVCRHLNTRMWARDPLKALTKAETRIHLFASPTRAASTS